MRLAVIGLGAAGLSAALAGAEAGLDVVGFEQSDLDNQEASSGGRGKIIRFGYADPFYAALMRSTMARWTALADRTGARLMDRHGGLHIGSPATVAGIERGIIDAGQRCQVVDGDTEPLGAFGVRLADDESAAYEPAAGVMWTWTFREALAREATSAGAELRERTRVEAIESADGRVAVRTADGVEIFDHAIVAGGPWVARLAPTAAPAFAITRRYQLVYTGDGPIGDGLARPWIDMSEPGFYGMINVAPNTHLIGLHETGEQPVDDPDEPDDERVRAASIAAQIAYVRERFAVTPEPIDIRACHYTSTASRDFVIDDCPDRPGVTLLSACSGHGFKFSITVGGYAVAIATGSSIPDRERFRLQFATMI
jgi:sarcosine oxidase